MKKITYIMLIITLFIFIIFEFKIDKSLARKNEDVNLNILTTDKLQYEMVKKIVGNKHTVQYIYIDENKMLNEKYNIELIKKFKPDIIFYSSLNCEELISNISKELKDVNLVDVSRGIRVLKYESQESKDNPYYWNGKEEYLIGLYNMESAIKDMDPVNINYYKSKYNEIKDYIETNIEDIKSTYNFDDYIFISVDDYFDYLYKDLDIHIKKMKEENIENYIEKNNIDINKIIILKDSKTKISLKNIRVTNLERYPENADLLENYKILKSI